MTDEHQRIVKRNLVELCKGLNVEDIFVELISEGILNEDDMERIKLQGSQKDKTLFFLVNVFLKKPDSAFDKLVQILKVTDKEHCAELLQP